MRRLALLLVLAAALVGGLVAVRWPAEAIGGSRFIVYMVPPVGDSGDYGHLHCK